MPSAGPGVSPWNALLLVALAALAFASVAAGVRRLVPWPSEYGLRAKWEHFALHKDEYDLVFIGSSHVWRAFDPALFDGEVAKLGLECRSFNLGVGGSRSWEWDFLVHEVLALEPERLSWILVEAAPWDPELPANQSAFNLRTVHWHTPSVTGRALAATAISDRPLGERLELGLTHLQLLLWNLSGFGQGRRIAADLLGIELKAEVGYDVEPEAYLAGEGHQTQERLTSPEFQRQRKAWRQRIRRIEEETARGVDPEHAYPGALRAQVDAARARGVELVHVVMPGDAAVPEPVELHARPDMPALLDFNRPSRYPLLFQVQTRFSPHHLNRVGAERFTRMLAIEIARHARKLARN